MTNIFQQVCPLEDFPDLFAAKKFSMKKYSFIILYLNIL